MAPLRGLLQPDISDRLNERWAFLGCACQSFSGWNFHESSVAEHHTLSSALASRALR
jgi:hypothetical protein